MANNFPITKKYITEYGKSVESEIKTRLKNYGRYASGKLLNSIKFRYYENKSSFSLQFAMNDYGKYIDKGVKGSKINRAGNTPYKYTNKMPPTKVFDRWIISKGIAPRDDKGKFKSRSSLKFAIARSVFLKGITPTNFFTIPTTRREKQFNNTIEKTMAQDLDNLAKGLNG